PRTTAAPALGFGRILVSRPVLDLLPPRPARAEPVLLQPELTWGRARRTAPWAGATIGHRRAQCTRALAGTPAVGAGTGPVIFGRPGSARRGGPGRAGTGFGTWPRGPGGGARRGAHLGRVVGPGPRPEPGVRARPEPRFGACAGPPAQTRIGGAGPARGARPRPPRP